MIYGSTGQYTNSMNASTPSLVPADRPADYVLDFHSRYTKDIPTGELGATSVQEVGHRVAKYTGHIMKNIAAFRILGASVPNVDTDLHISLGRHVCSDDGGGQYEYYESITGEKSSSDKGERTIRFAARHGAAGSHNTLEDYGLAAPVFWAVDSTGKGRDVQSLSIEWKRQGKRIEEIGYHTSAHTYEVRALPRYLLQAPSGVFEGEVLVPDADTRILARVRSASIPQVDRALENALDSVTAMVFSASAPTGDAKIPFFDDDLSLRIRVDATGIQGINASASTTVGGTGGEIMLFINQTDSQTANTASRYHYARVARGGAGYPSTPFTLSIPYSAIDRSYTGAQNDHIQLTVSSATVDVSTANTAIKERMVATTPEMFHDADWTLRVRSPFHAVLEATIQREQADFAIDGVRLTSSHVGREVVVQSLCQTAKDQGRLRVVYETHDDTSLPWTSAYNALVGDIASNVSGSAFDIRRIDPAVWNGVYRIDGLDTLSGSYPFDDQMRVQGHDDTQERTTLVMRKLNDDLASDRIHSIGSGDVYGGTMLVCDVPRHSLSLQVGGAGRYYGERSLFGQPRLYRPFLGVRVPPTAPRAVCSLVEVEYCARTAEGGESVLSTPSALLLGGAHTSLTAYTAKVYSTLKDAVEGKVHRGQVEVAVSHRDVLVDALSPFSRQSPPILQFGGERRDQETAACVAQIRSPANTSVASPLPTLRIDGGMVYATLRVLGPERGLYPTVKRFKEGDSMHVHGGKSYDQVLLSSQTGADGKMKVKGTTTVVLQKITNIQQATPGLYPWSLRIGLYKAATV